MDNNRVLTNDDGSIQFKYNVDIQLEIDNTVMTSIREFNEKNNVRFDASHLPFRAFKCTSKEEYTMNELSEYESSLYSMCRNLGRTDSEIKAALEKFYNTPIKDSTCKVTITEDKFCVDLDGDGVVIADITYNENIEQLDDVLENVGIAKIPSILLNSLEENSELAQKFKGYCAITMSNMLNLISFLSYNNRVDNRELFESVDTIVINDRKQGKNKGKNKKPSNKRKRIIKVSKLTLTEDKIRKVKSFRGYERKTNEWFTIGHWRTYKSGKKVWIEPTVKRAKGSKASKNTISQNYVIRD